MLFYGPVELSGCLSGKPSWKIAGRKPWTQSCLHQVIFSIFWATPPPTCSESRLGSTYLMSYVPSILETQPHLEPLPVCPFTASLTHQSDWSLIHLLVIIISLINPFGFNLQSRICSLGPIIQPCDNHTIFIVKHGDVSIILWGYFPVMWT